MASQKRQSDSYVKDRLFEKFYSFSFFKAVQLLEAIFPDREKLGQALVPAKEPVRFSVKPGFAFPPSEIANLHQDREDRPVTMEIAFMGLVGPSGVLPHWYNELALERQRQKDSSFTAFLDIFHHRLTTLFYLAWKKYRVAAQYQPGVKDKTSRYLLSFCGLGTPYLVDRIGLPEESLIYCSGLLSRQAPSAAAIEAVVEYLSGAATHVEQFIERAIFLEPEDRTTLGLANAQLGVTALCGSYVWDCQTVFRVNLGPMSYEDFLRFLPCGDMLRRIFALVKYMVGMEYEFELRIFLKHEEVPPCRLGADSPSAARLGWSTWMKAPDFIHSTDQYVTFREQDLTVIN